VQMNGEFNSRHSEENVFAVSAKWFHAWQRFVRGDSEGTLQFNFSEARSGRVCCLTCIS